MPPKGKPIPAAGKKSVPVAKGASKATSKPVAKKAPGTTA